MTTDNSRTAVIGADEPVPGWMQQFVAEVLNACGPVVSDAFKIELIRTPGMTIRQALEASRKEVERLHSDGKAGAP